MSSNALHTAGNTTAVASLATSLFTWAGENASAIGAVTSVALAILTSVFYFLNYRLNKRRLELDIENARQGESK